MTHETIRPSDTQGPSPAELTLVGEIGLILEGGREPDALDAALLRLRSAAGANVCELFLVTPHRGEMVLVSHQGADADAFLQRDRFQAGEGFPGMVLSGGAVLATRSLRTEDDFLRSRVKSAGYVGAICVPLRSGEDVVGCLLLAWKEPPPHWRSCIRASVFGSMLLSGAVDAARSRARWAGARIPDGSAASYERELKALTAADEARVVVFSSAGSGAPGRESYCRLTREECPACRTGRTQVLGARAGWPKECIRSRCVSRARYCVPLTQGDDLWGVASVAFRRRAPVPLTRRLPAMLWFTEGFTAPGQALPRAVDPDPGFGSDGGGEARLQIRCLGGFEVQLDGRVLHAADFARAKAHELLARLTLGGGTPLSAERLARDLWPRAPTTPSLLNRFHVTMSALRRVVEPPGARRPGWIHVRTDRGRYYLDPEASIRVDLWEFDRILRQVARDSLGAGERRSSAELMNHLARLYRGDAFDGVFESDWATDAGRLWRVRWIRVLRGLRGPPTPRVLRTFGGCTTDRSGEDSVRRPEEVEQDRS